MRSPLHAEWTKLRTVGGTLWLALGIAVLTVGVGAAAITAASPCPAPGCAEDVTKLSLVGVLLGQAVVVVLAVLAVGTEYGTGMIRATLAAMPRRSVVLGAKALLVVGLVLVAGAAGVLGSLLIARLVLPGLGFTSAHGYQALSLTHGPTLRAATGSVLYLGLIALLGLGVTWIVRDSAAAVGLVLGVLFVLPIISGVVTDPHWQRHLQQIAPMTAGLAIQTTVDLHGQPIGPWAGLGVLAAWSGGALLVGLALLLRRDA
jgi:ABC-2 type transport system permease protein